MLEYLVGDDEIELSRQDVAADIELGKIHFRIGAERKLPTPLRARRNLESVEPFGAKLADVRERAAVHDHAHPIGGVVPDAVKHTFSDRPQRLSPANRGDQGPRRV